jgi:hypothetical protein
MRMKVQAKTKEDYGSQQYKFRPRAFQIESIIEVDISTLGESMTNDSFSEWKELLSEEEFTTMVVLLYNVIFANYIRNKLYVQIFAFSMFHVLLYGTQEIASSF